MTAAPPAGAPRFRLARRPLYPACGEAGSRFSAPGGDAEYCGVSAGQPAVRFTSVYPGMSRLPCGTAGGRVRSARKAVPLVRNDFRGGWFKPGSDPRERNVLPVGLTFLAPMPPPRLQRWYRNRFLSGPPAIAQGGDHKTMVGDCRLDSQRL